MAPYNTDKCTKWALKNFGVWVTVRNTAHPEDLVPEDILMSSDPDVLNRRLSQFVVETHKSNGQFYPPAILCGLLRHMHKNNPGCPNFLDKKDSRFRQLHGTLDSYFNKLHSQGVGRRVKHAETISPEGEDKLWESGVLNTTTPKGLQNAVFHAVGKIFCLCGGQEHRVLKLSQFQRRDDSYVYYENVSKNRNGSFRQIHVKGKVVPVYSCPDAGDRCPVHLLDQYISKLPEEAKLKDLFYIRPLEKVTSDPTKPWYSAVPLGKNTLQQKVPKICPSAGIQGHKTNHSLRATGATEMYHCGAPEKLIQERTGAHMKL